MKNVPDAKDSEWFDEYNIKKMRFAFNEYNDAQVLLEMCQAEGFNAEIVEPQRNKQIPNRYKCFEVRQKAFMSLGDYEKTSGDSNRSSTK